MTLRSPKASPPWKRYCRQHIAEFAGVPATVITVRLPYSVFYGVANGRIAALRAYFPVMALSRQLAEAASAHA